MSTRTINPTTQAVRSRTLPITAWIDQHARLLLTVLIVGWIVVFSVAAVRKFQQYEMGFDVALIQQIIWNTLEGRPFETHAYDHTNNILGTDSFLIHLIFIPFYAIFPNPTTLLVVQTIIVGTSALAVYLLARDHVRQPWVALTFAAVYLAYQPVMYGNLYEIRERVLAMAWVLWILLCIQRRWFWPMLLPMVLALLCRLDTTIGIALVGVYALLLRWPSRSQPEPADQLPAGPVPWRFGFTLIGSAVVWYLFVTKVMVPYYTDRPGYMFLEHYRQFGDTVGEVIFNVLTNPLNTLSVMLMPAKLWFLLGMFLPLAFLSLLNWRLLVVMLPLYGLNLLAPRKIQWDVYHHYQGLIVPLMLLAAITGLASLVRRRVFGVQTMAWGVGALLLGTLVSQVLFDNPLPGLLNQWAPTTREISANELVTQLPADAPVAVGSLLAPHISPRRDIYLVPGGDFFYVADPFAKAEYALVDMQKEHERTATEAALNSGGWCVVDAKADYLLLKKQVGAQGERCTL